MCGIVACIHPQECSNILYNGLTQLKNRGYDSAGICSINNESQYIIDKYASGETDSYIKLHNSLHRHKSSQIGIAHTRWATHGAKTDVNSHPHISMCGKFSVVHNGIIENYKALKRSLETDGYIFKSQTDTEVIVQLLSFLYKKHNNVTQCIEIMISQLEGTWGIAILCLDQPNTIYCTRHGSPILVGRDDNSCIIVSEQSGFCNKKLEYFTLDNMDICKILLQDNGRISIETNKPYITKIAATMVSDLTPSPYSHWTIKEIHEQVLSSARAISMGGRLLNNNQVKLGGLEQYTDVLTNMDNLIVLGCGTSYFAGQHGLYFFKEISGFNTVQLFDGAEFCSHDIPKSGNTALLLISQSGETKDLHRCIEIGKKHNLMLIGVVNVVDSLIAREVHCGCYLNAGREVGVASTKAYSSQVILLSMIAIWFAQQRGINKNKRHQYIQNIKQISQDIQTTLNQTEPKIEHIIKSMFVNRTHCFLLGKGKSESVAKEGALKIKEIAYIHSEGYSTSSLKHGPFALLDEHFPVIIIAPNDEYYSKGENAYEEITSRKSPILFITDNLDTEKENVLFIPPNETFRDLLAIIPLQLLAYKLSVSLGLNPDMPKNLAKVVTVE